MSKFYIIDNAFDDLISFERGRFYIWYLIITEAIEVISQAYQLFQFAHVRPYEWIIATALILMLNGLLIPAPFLLMTYDAKYENNAKVFLFTIDAIFDAASLLVAITFSEKDSFGGESWLVAVLAVVVPLLGVSLRAWDISEVSRNNIVSKEWREMFGAGRDRRHSVMILKSDLNKRMGRPLTTAVTKQGPPGSLPSHSLETRLQNQGVHRCRVMVSLILSFFCVACGAIFFNMAISGYAECGESLGDALWAGAAPKIVVVKHQRYPKGGCDLRQIRTIKSSAKTSKLNRIPTAVTKLEMLESLELFGHNVSSDGVPIRTFDGITIPRLTRLNFGNSSPVTHHLVLRKSSASSTFKVFPPYVLQFMTALKSLQMSGTDLTCLPSQNQISKLRNLESLNVSSTKVDYLPPSLVFYNSLLTKLDLHDTPVYKSLDWSHHSLGEKSRSTFTKGWKKMLNMLPRLESLNISSNGLDDAVALNLTALGHLRRLDVSQNPNLTPHASSNGFSWWRLFSQHPSLKFRADYIGLANVGLGAEHIQILNRSTAALSCKELGWLLGATKPKAYGETPYHTTRSPPPPSSLEARIEARNVLSVHIGYPKKTTARAKATYLSVAIYQRKPSFRGAVLYCNGEPYLPKVYAKFCRVSRCYVENQYCPPGASGSSHGHCCVRGKSGELRWHDGHFCLSNDTNFQAHRWINSLVCPLPSSPALYKKIDISTSPNEIRTVHFTEKIQPGKETNSLGIIASACNAFGCSAESIAVNISSLCNCSIVQMNVPNPEEKKAARLDLSQNKKFETFLSWSIDSDEQHRCDCALTGQCEFVDEALMRLLSGVLINVKSLAIGQIFRGTPLIKVSHHIFKMVAVNTQLTYLRVTENTINLLTSDVGLLTNLRHLKLRGNCFAGEIPRDISKLIQLHELDLDNCCLSGAFPLGLTALKDMTKLSFFNNKLVGFLPRGISALTKLRVLRLRNNLLTGGIPEGISTLQNLREWNVGGNDMNGSIPTTITTLTKLEVLDLGSNMFEGSIPNGLHVLKRLVFLSLGANYIHDHFPEELTTLTNLQTVYLDINSLRGTIPQGISALTKLRVLRLGNNLLTGRIPEGVFALENLVEMDLSNNKLSGYLPSDIGKLRHLQKFSIQTNMFSGQIPKEMTRLTKLLHLVVGSNSFNGTIPQGISNLIRLSYLDLQDNRFTGNISGITALTNLIYLHLGNNSLHGRLPLGISALTRLTELHLLGNNFLKPLPQQIGFMRLSAPNSPIYEYLP